MKNKSGPRVLYVDIETSPIISYCWGLFDQNIGLNQIHTDWHLLSWAARWSDDPEGKTMYMDQSKAKDIENDKKILQGIWKLLDESDIVVGQNSKSFDIKRLNARFLIHGMAPPSSFKQIDTLRLMRKHFSMTSNKLEFLSDKLCKKYKKLKHNKFSGFELWKECLKGNKSAWKEMSTYNRHDVLSTQELHEIIKAWDNSINFNLYSSSTGTTCTCGASNWLRNGYAYTSVAKYQRYKCKKCSSEIRDRKNLLDQDKKESLKTGTSR